jgi:hypothetical protein
MKYILMAYRYGQDGFPIGVFSTLEKAKEEAKLHMNFRGPKFSHTIFVAKEDVGYGYGHELEYKEDKVIVLD